MKPIGREELENQATQDGTKWCGVGCAFDYLVMEYLLHNRQKGGELVLTPEAFFEFFYSLRTSAGTIYPYADGGIRFAGPLGWVIVKPGYE